MYKDIILQKLTEMRKAPEIRGDEVISLCLNPNHKSNKKLYSTNITHAYGKCWSCGYANSPKFFLEDVEDDDKLWDAKYNSLIQKQESEERSSITHVLPPVDLYLDKPWRGISTALLQKVGAYYSSMGKYKGRNIFPIYKDDVLLGFDARIVDSTAMFPEIKWIRPAGMIVQDIVYPHSIIAEQRPDHIVIVEGLMDALSYIQMGVIAIPSFGLSSPSMVRITELIRLGVEKVTLALDNDERGQAAILRFIQAYGEWFDIVPHDLVNLVRLSGEKDANDFLIKYKKEKDEA